jgi:tetratricopeptide (TPR) repeat protein
MSFNLEGRRIFLAAPGDLATERQTIRQTIAAYNDQYSPTKSVAFLARGSEHAKRGLGRPQELINEELNECDYMMVVLGERWGSSSGADEYSSGTEEEFFRAIERRGSVDAQIRDIHVFFKSVDRNRILDPGPQLRKVMNFRRALESTKVIYFETFDTDKTLRSVVEQSLNQWAEDKAPRVHEVIDFTPSHINAALTVSTQSTVPGLLESAKAKWDSGLTFQAETLFAEAAKHNDPDALDAFAKFKRRTGELEYAKRLNRAILTGDLLLATDRESISRIVRAQSNIGVILRKQGHIEDSVRVFREAIQQARAGEGSREEDLAYALDNYGHSLLQLMRKEEAADQFAAASALRQAIGDNDGLAQSSVIAGHKLTQSGDPEAALERFSEALRFMSDDSGGLKANALAGKGKCLHKLGRFDDAVVEYNAALETNRLIRNSDGTSIALCGLADAALALGRLDLAKQQAESALSESLQSSNSTGIATANWILYRISKAGDGSLEEQSGFMSRAMEFARRANNPGLLGAIERTNVP